MKNNQLPLPLKWAVLCLLLTLFTVSCEKTEFSEVERSANESRNNASSRTGVTTIKLQSGEDLFKQIMFARGEAAKAIPELQRVRDLSGIDQLDKDQQELASLIEDAIALQINESDPEFFGKFAELLQSGNPIKVQEGLRLGGEQIVNALAAKNPELYALTKLRNGEFYEKLTPEQKKRLARIAELDQIDLDEIRKIIEDLDLTDQIGTNIALHQAQVLQNTLQISLDQNINLNNQLVRNFNVQLNQNLNLQQNNNLNLSNQLQNQLDLQLDNNINIARQINLQRSFNVDLNAFYDSGVGASVWYETDVVAVAYVAVAIVAVAVINVIDFTPLTGPEFNDKILFQEQLVANITKTFAIESQFR